MLIDFKTFQLPLKQSIKIIAIKTSLCLQFHWKVGWLVKGLREADLNSKGRSCDPVLEASGPRHQQQQDGGRHSAALLAADRPGGTEKLLELINLSRLKQQRGGGRTDVKGVS